MPQHIIVTEYNPDWPQMFQQEMKKIERILGDNCVAVCHIGSTSVPGLAAKPIIDMMPIVKELAAADAVSAEFEKIGYEYLGEFGISGRRYLRKGGDERTHHLALRDYLRTHPEAREAYGKLKKQLAEKYPYDIDGYYDGKDAFVRELEQRALCQFPASEL